MNVWRATRPSMTFERESKHVNGQPCSPGDRASVVSRRPACPATIGISRNRVCLRNASLPRPTTRVMLSATDALALGANAIVSRGADSGRAGRALRRQTDRELQGGPDDQSDRWRLGTSALCRRSPQPAEVRGPTCASREGGVAAGATGRRVQRAARVWTWHGAVNGRRGH
jgi:hypothetical protein